LNPQGSGEVSESENRKSSYIIDFLVRFAEALEHSLRRKERKCAIAIANIMIQPEPSQPLFSSPLLLKTKKREIDF
jgi:hypothetical protein